MNQRTYLGLKQETYDLGQVRQNLIRPATFPFLGFSISPSHFLEILQIVLMLKFAICIPLRILRRNVNRSNFTPMICNISPARPTHVEL